MDFKFCSERASFIAFPYALHRAPAARHAVSMSFDVSLPIPTVSAAHQGEWSPWGQGTRGKLVPDETGSGERRQRKGCFKQGGDGPRVWTDPPRVKSLQLMHQKKKRKGFLFPFFTSGPYFLFFFFKPKHHTHFSPFGFPLSPSLSRHYFFPFLHSLVYHHHHPICVLVLAFISLTSSD